MPVLNMLKSIEHHSLLSTAPPSHMSCRTSTVACVMPSESERGQANETNCPHPLGRVTAVLCPTEAGAGLRRRVAAYDLHVFRALAGAVA